MFNMEDDLKKIELFECACYLPNHMFYVSKYDDEDEFYFHVQLNNWLPWYKRIYYAVKYIFGGDCGWDETILGVYFSNLFRYNFASNFFSKYSFPTLKIRFI